MGLLGAGSGTASGKQITAGSDPVKDEDVLEQVIVNEANEAGR